MKTHREGGSCPWFLSILRWPHQRVGKVLVWLYSEALKHSHLVEFGGLYITAMGRASFHRGPHKPCAVLRQLLCPQHRCSPPRSVLLACMKGKPHSRLHGGCKLCHEGSVQYSAWVSAQGCDGAGRLSFTFKYLIHLKKADCGICAAVLAGVCRGVLMLGPLPAPFASHPATDQALSS